MVIEANETDQFLDAELHPSRDAESLELQALVQSVEVWASFAS